MADLPKIVRDRLRAAAAEPHPDADLLTAFAEKRLGERERAQVLDHLAACSACREVVALARPEEEKEAAAAPLPARGWVLRWQTAVGVAAVAVAAVALLVVPSSFFRTGRSTAPQVAQAPAPAGKTAAPREEANAPAAETRTLNGKLADKVAPAKPTASGEKKEAAGAAGKVSTELAKAQAAPVEEKDRFGGLEAPAQKETSALAPPPPPPPAAVSGAAVADQAVAPAAGAQRSAVGGVVTGQGAGQAANAQPRKAPAVPATSETVEVQASAPAVQTTMASVEVVPQWRTTTKGKLEHSRDNGQTWHTVNVAADATLNAVSAVGPNMWVGGHQQHLAVLYYSADSGAHWTRLDFTSPTAVPPADIVALHFTDAQNGVMTVVPSEAELQLRQIWTTSDGGHTWKVRGT